MGHYDEEFVPERYRRKRKKKNTFLSGLIGAIIGGFIVLIFGSFFLNNDQAKDGNLGINQPQGTKITRQVSYEVDTTITKAVEKVADSVVGITNIQGASFWTQAQEAGTGSGVVYKVSGDSAYIVTNYHVIEGANSLEVTLADGTKLPAELVGSDIWTDLAVIKVDSGPIKTVAEFGNSDTLKLGETVIAIETH